MVNFENGKTPINDSNLNKMQTDFMGELLYSNPSKAIEDAILLKSTAEYKKLLINYEYSGISSSVIVTNPDGKKVSLGIGFSITLYNLARYQYKVIAIDKTKITTSSSGYLSISEAGITGVSSTENSIAITEVFGYKEV